MFCWFLKKKDFIPEALLSLSSVNNSHDYGYYHSVLEPLFFEVLNKEINERFDSYKQDDWQKIPFLNGGLFDAHWNDFYQLDDGHSNALNTLIVSDDWIKTIFSLFENYHFTIEENTPIDIQISIEPKMLGQIFENLLAEINPITEENARKATGSFYTPPEIVDYMVNESLKAYFKSKFENFNDANLLGDHDLMSLSKQNDLLHRLDDLLNETEIIPEFSLPEKKAVISAVENLKILDPACGSGAFPIGILQKLVVILRHIDSDANLWLERVLAKTPDPQVKQMMRNKLKGDKDLLDYTRKLGIIRDCIYGVDIQPIAAEITKLRCFLSLIVDEKIDYSNPVNYGVIALPSLEFKFICANSLIALFAKGMTNLFEDREAIEKLKELRNEYLTCHGNRKNEIKIEFKDIQYKMADNVAGNETVNLATWKPFDNVPCGWFDADLMFGIKNAFDIVIGNPPYIQIQKFSGQQCQKDWQNQHYATFEKTGDIYALFIEKGVSLLKQNGLLTFITSNKWMRAGYGKSLREFLATKTSPLKLIDFGGYQVFESATVDSNILITQNNLEKSLLHACTIQNDFTIETNLADYFTAHQQNISLKSTDAWVISSGIEQQIKAKIESKGTPLKEWDVNIYFGIKTGFNEAFIIDTETKERLCKEDAKSVEIIKPILRGRDIKRYCAEWAGLWLINSHNNPPVNINNYPAIKKHLDFYYLQLENRSDQGSTPYNLRQCAYLKELQEEKIIYPDIMRLPRESNSFENYPYFYLDKNGYYPEATNFTMIGKSLHLIIAVISSKLGVYAFTKYYCGTQFDEKGFRYKKEFLEKLPIPKISHEQQQPFIGLVDKILAAKKQNQNTAALEREIDEMVYALYGLTDDEIKIIEGGK